MNKTHELKCWPEVFQAMRDGTKKFEFRKDDRNYQVGDIVHNREWDPESGAYTGREDRYRVTYKLGCEFGVPVGFCVLGVEPVESVEELRAELDRLKKEIKETMLPIVEEAYYDESSAFMVPGSGYNHRAQGRAGRTWGRRSDKEFKAWKASLGI